MSPVHPSTLDWADKANKFEHFSAEDRNTYYTMGGDTAKQQVKDKLHNPPYYYAAKYRSPGKTQSDSYERGGERLSEFAAAWADTRRTYGSAKMSPVERKALAAPLSLAKLVNNGLQSLDSYSEMAVRAVFKHSEVRDLFSVAAREAAKEGQKVVVTALGVARGEATERTFTVDLARIGADNATKPVGYLTGRVSEDGAIDFAWAPSA